ncbi:hypothetical protein AMTR_s00006p00238400 [Amborella trichopoda]|uniref:Uncharacterized protein n=1 Tax=Amborella trichopoda TaxID=13333 RepID=W1PDF2_AMBTC|nr:hypothetical protein AMTR_s00006p00238400 [Amborella trichopoda]
MNDNLYISATGISYDTGWCNYQMIMRRKPLSFKDVAQKAMVLPSEEVDDTGVGTKNGHKEQAHRAATQLKVLSQKISKISPPTSSGHCKNCLLRTVQLLSLSSPAIPTIMMVVVVVVVVVVVAMMSVVAMMLMMVLAYLAMAIHRTTAKGRRSSKKARGLTNEERLGKRRGEGFLCAAEHSEATCDNCRRKSFHGSGEG